jgi:hypothetical protein
MRNPDKAGLRIVFLLVLIPINRTIHPQSRVVLTQVIDDCRLPIDDWSGCEGETGGVNRLKLKDHAAEAGGVHHFLSRARFQKPDESTIQFQVDTVWCTEENLRSTVLALQLKNSRKKP